MLQEPYGRWYLVTLPKNEVGTLMNEKRTTKLPINRLNSEASQTGSYYLQSLLLARLTPSIGSTSVVMANFKKIFKLASLRHEPFGIISQHNLESRFDYSFISIIYFYSAFI